MKIEYGSYLPAILIPALITTVLLSGILGVVQASQFPPPSLEGFSIDAERDSDGDGDGVNETQIKQYINENGDSIVSMTTRGRLWAWSLNSKESESPLHNYVIRDSNCDGIFEEVYGLDDEFHIPECLK